MKNTYGFYFYWPVEALVCKNLRPSIYREGKYDSSLKYLYRKITHKQHGYSYASRRALHKTKNTLPKTTGIN